MGIWQVPVSYFFFQTCVIYKDKTGLFRGGRDDFSFELMDT